MLMALSATSQSVWTNYDKRIIRTDSLNMPQTTSAMTLITLLPELLQRPGDYILSNYDVQVEGMSVGKASDVVLSQLQIADIKQIEVCESPISSYLNNGQGGTINFVLRTAWRDGAPLWGSVGVSGSSYVDLSPQLNLGYRKGGFMVRSLVLGELSNLSHTTHTESFADGRLTESSIEERSNRFRTEMARAYLEYDWTDRDKLKLNLSESYTFEKDEKTNNYEEAQAVKQSKKTTNLHAYLRYQHDGQKDCFVAQVEFIHAPSRNSMDTPNTYFYDGKVRNDNLSGKLEYTRQLFNSETLGSGSLSIGTNINNVFGDEHANYGYLFTYKNPNPQVTPKNNTNYLMPYLTFSCELGKVRLKARGEFHHFNYEVDMEQHSYKAVSNNFTGNLMTEWHMNKGQQLRLIFHRSLQRPTGLQLYPFLTFDPKQVTYVQGNPNLTPSPLNEVLVDYLGHFNLKRQQKLTLNAGVSYNHVSDIVTPYASKNTNAPGSLGVKLNPKSFRNKGVNHIANVNLMALYTYKDFSISAVGNFYHKVEKIDGASDHATYYNISVHPYFNLNNGWYGGARIVYYSRIGKSDGWTDGQAITSMNVGRTWRHFSVFLTEEVGFLKNRKDVTRFGTHRTERTSLLVGNEVGIGVRYIF